MLIKSWPRNVKRLSQALWAQHEQAAPDTISKLLLQLLGWGSLTGSFETGTAVEGTKKKDGHGVSGEGRREGRTGRGLGGPELNYECPELPSLSSSTQRPPCF